MSNELQKFEPLKVEISELVAPVMLAKVTDFRSSQLAIDAAKTLKAMDKRIDELRRAEVDPLNAQVKAINEYVKQIRTPLDAADSHIRNQLNAFAMEQERIKQEELRRAAEEKRKADEELRAKQEAEKLAMQEGAALFGGSDEAEAVAELEEKQMIERRLADVDFQQKTWDIGQQQLKNTRKTWKVKVTDITKVPREFLIITLNEKAALAARTGGVSIPGVEFYQEIGVAIGQKTRVPKAAIEGESQGE